MTAIPASKPSESSISATRARRSARARLACRSAHHRCHGVTDASRTTISARAKRVAALAASSQRNSHAWDGQKTPSDGRCRHHAPVSGSKARQRFQERVCMLPFNDRRPRLPSAFYDLFMSPGIVFTACSHREAPGRRRGQWHPTTAKARAARASVSALPGALTLIGPGRAGATSSESRLLAMRHVGHTSSVSSRAIRPTTRWNLTPMSSRSLASGTVS